MVNNVKSVVVTEHKDDCKALKWVKEGQTPTVWNVIHPKHCFYCGEDGRDVDITQTGHSTLYYEFCCGDDDCPARKRVHAQSVAEM